MTYIFLESFQFLDTVVADVNFFKALKLLEPLKLCNSV